MNPAEPYKSPQDLLQDDGVRDAILMTRQYYEEHAEEYFRRTVSADLSHLYDRFLPYVRAGGRILDLGCGSGRDLRAFTERGFLAFGIESSKALVEKARAYSGAECVVGRIEELAYQSQFDGVWACASLLHLSRASIENVLSRANESLLPAGVLYVSVQEGDGDFIVTDGRFYTLYKESEFLHFFKATGFEVLEVWNSQDALERKRPIRWLNVLGRTIKGASASGS